MPKTKVTDVITAYRAYRFERDAGPIRVDGHAYEVLHNGARVGYFFASDLSQARGLAGKALAEAYASPFNQSLVFDGHIREGEVAATQLAAALRRVFDARDSHEG